MTKYVPTSSFEAELFKKAEEYGIDTDITHRWEQSVEHHPKAKAIARSIAAADWLWGGDCFGFKFGGDGDNGEHLIYLLDILFAIEDETISRFGN
jgi:hypothetical protein